MNLNKSKEELKNEIIALKDKIASLNIEIKQLDETKKELEKNYDAICTEENTKYITKKVSLINETNTIEKLINEDTKTIPLIDEFCKSQKPNLILNTEIYYYADNLDIKTDVQFAYKVSYLVIKHYPRIYYKHNFTMTELKKDIKCRQYDFRYCDEAKSKNLYNELQNALREYFVTINEEGKYTVKADIDFSKDKIDIPLKNIILLRAQSSKNRTGYGNEYNGETLVREGTNYGDTTHFLIIGIRLTKDMGNPYRFFGG